jgi:TPR repeat protein
MKNILLHRAPGDMFVEASRLLDSGRAKEAYRLFLRAAMDGHSHSKHNVALLLELGEGVRRNEQLAIKWYIQAWRHDHQLGTAENLLSLYLKLGNARRARYWQAHVDDLR